MFPFVVVKNVGPATLILVVLGSRNDYLLQRYIHHMNSNCKTQQQCKKQS